MFADNSSELCGCNHQATCIGKDPADIDGLENGAFSFAFASPEVLVGETKWRDVLKSPCYRQKLKLLVVDEAHTVIQWGEGKAGEGPFRQWFARVGELRSLCLGVPLAALTATSGPLQRRAIMKKLSFRPNSVVVLDSPDRDNIKITAQKVDNSKQIRDTFRWLTDGLEHQGDTFPRHVVFCPSMSDCSKVYQCFARKFGVGCKQFQMYMYHSQTNDRVKETIRSDMGKMDGTIRVLICTNAAGMGVNFMNVHNVVHYGLPRELDTFVQQMGRAGRDGQLSDELILFKCHKGHMKRVETELVKLVKEDACRHKQLCENYLFTNKQIVPFHNCCDVCAAVCECGNDECPRRHPYQIGNTEEDVQDEVSREVTEDDKKLLFQKLTSLRYCMESSDPELFHGELLHGLSDSVIRDICMKCSVLFSPEDVVTHVACWSYDMATKIANAVNVVFGDRELFEELSDNTESDD